MTSLGPMADPDSKEKGDSSMPLSRLSCPGVRGVGSARSSWPTWPQAAPETSASAPSRTAGSSPATYLGGRSPPLISANVSARSGSMLGVAIATAVAWVHAAGGDWANYAALVTEDNPQC